MRSSWTKKRAIAAALATVTVLAVAPRGARAWKSYREEQRRARIVAAIAALKAGDDVAPISLRTGVQEPESKTEGKRDDPLLRELGNLLEWGNRTPEFHARLRSIAASEAQRWPQTLPGAQSAAAAAVPAWLSLGPTNADFEYNGTVYNAVDTGRPTSIRQDPRNTAGDVLYLAVSGGGIWKTTNLSGSLATPKAAVTWTAVSEGATPLANEAVGAMDVDFSDTTAAKKTVIWAGLGDAFDGQSGTIARSADDGATWTFFTLTGLDPTDQHPIAAVSVRDLRIDPNNTQNILVATDIGLFRSVVAAGAVTGFAHLDLPNANTTAAAGVPHYEESTWSLAYLGSSGGNSSFMVTGVYACDVKVAPLPPGYGTAPGGTTPLGTPCPGGTVGDIWTSTDSGATWFSQRVNGNLPNADLLGVDLGRMTIAAGAPQANPATTVVYAQAGSVDDAQQVAILANNTSGATTTGNPAFRTVGLASDPTNLDNPTNSTNCDSLDVAHGQVWYNQAIVVDPTNSNNVLLGGNLCSVRSINGGANWQNTSHWLPSGGGGLVQTVAAPNGAPLPYVHADWHTASFGSIGGKTVIFAGTDGGFFASPDVFSNADVTAATWVQPDVGLVTHLAYSIATGEITRGDHAKLLTGLQDNGTRWRAHDSTYNQIVGGDGFGTALSYDATGQSVAWQSVYTGGPGDRSFCRDNELRHSSNLQTEPNDDVTAINPPVVVSCNTATFKDTTGLGYVTWTPTDLPFPSNPDGSADQDPFVIRYAAVNDAAGSVLTASTFNIWRLTVDAAGVFAPVNLTPGDLLFNAGRAFRGNGPVASPATYTVNGKSARLYGAPTGGGRFLVGVDTGGAVSWSFTKTRYPASIGTASIAFPAAETFDATFVPQTYLVASNNAAAVPAHLFRTTDAGATFTAFAGGLPNIPINVVRFDPTTDNTIYAGTELGVYRSTDAGATWSRFGAGLPMVRVTDLNVSATGTLVRISTYGRGLWEVYTHSAAGTGSGDWDASGAIDWRDLAAVASRYHQAPLGAAYPIYDAAADLNGDGAIDDTDLNALLTKWGNTP
jgi:hypothetical protein